VFVGGVGEWRECGLASVLTRAEPLSALTAYRLRFARVSIRPHFQVRVWFSEGASP